MEATSGRGIQLCLGKQGPHTGHLRMKEESWKREWTLGIEEGIKDKWMEKKEKVKRNKGREQKEAEKEGDRAAGCLVPCILPVYQKFWLKCLPMMKMEGNKTMSSLCG